MTAVVKPERDPVVGHIGPQPLVQGPWFLAWGYVAKRDNERSKVGFTKANRAVNVWTDGPYLERAAAETLASSPAGYDAVIEGVRYSGAFEGVGVVFSASHRLVGVDLDGCRDPTTGEVAPWAQRIVDGLRAEAVPSPSGKGLRVWLLAPKDATGPRKRKWTPTDAVELPGLDKAPGVEVFLTGGYCTITEDAAPVERPAELAALLATAPAPATSGMTTELAPRNMDLSLDDLERLIAMRHPKRYHKLFIAGVSPKDDDSDLDRELAGYAVEVAGGDIPRVETLMRRSAIARDETKWKRRDYLNRTIAHAMKTSTADGAGAPTSTEETVALGPSALPPFESFGELHDNPTPDTGWRVESIWPAGARGWIAGEPKVGKSWLAYDMAVCVVLKLPFLGQFEVKEPGPVLILTEESTRRKVYNRIRMLLLAKGITEPDATLRDRLHVLVRKGVKLTDPSWLAHVQRERARLKPVMIIVDPLRRYHDNPENQSHEVAPILQALASLNEGDTDVVVVHHMRKSNETTAAESRTGQQMAGSRDLHAWNDAALYCTAIKAERTCFQVEAEFKDDAPPEPFVVTLEYGAKQEVTVGAESVEMQPITLAVSAAAKNLEEVKRQSIAQKLLAELKEHAPERRTVTQLKGAVRRSERDDVSPALEWLKKKGLADMEIGKRGAHYWGLTEPVPDEPEPVPPPSEPVVPTAGDEPEF